MSMEVSATFKCDVCGASAPGRMIVTGNFVPPDAWLDVSDPWDPEDFGGVEPPPRPDLEYPLPEWIYVDHACGATCVEVLREAIYDVERVCARRTFNPPRATSDELKQRVQVLKARRVKEAVERSVSVMSETVAIVGPSDSQDVLDMLARAKAILADCERVESGLSPFADLDALSYMWNKGQAIRA